MSVNVSLRELKEPGFEAQLVDILHKTGMPRDSLELEITESVLAEDMVRAGERLRRIQALGVTIAIDDFGTGYSSLTYLREFPVDTLKIDRIFVQDVPSNAAAASLLVSIMDMAGRLGKRTVAEGIETPEQAHFLEKCRCTFLQGYLYSKPLPESEFLAYARARNVPGLRNVA
jgi:EAL domain-containing protein (putative c-di-GMP-specific phosphodiesterase class I)